MENIKFKKIYLTLFSCAVFCICFFSSGSTAKAQTYGTVTVNAYTYDSHGSRVNYSNLGFQIYSTQNSTHHWKSASLGCKGCDLAVRDNSAVYHSWNGRTDGGGYAKWGDGKLQGFACGHSVCSIGSQGDGGDCNPFRFTADAGRSGYWDVNLNGHAYNYGDQNPMQTDFDMDNQSNNLFEVWFHPSPETPNVRPRCEGAISKADISWSGDPAGGFWVDIDDDGNWGNGFWNKNIGKNKWNTTAPDGFNGYAGYAGRPLKFNYNATYWVRVYNGTHSGTRPFVAATCSSDNLSVSLSANPTSVTIDYYNPKPVTFTANTTHNRVPADHGIKKYEWDFDNDGIWDRVDNVNSLTASATYYYNWNFVKGGDRNINPRVRVTCERGKTAEASTTLQLKRATHEIICRSLTPRPIRGIVPLDVLFTADVYDTWGHEIKTYDWIFNLPTKPLNTTVWDRTTTGIDADKTNYTYTQRGDYTAWVRGHSGEPGVPYSDSCPASNTIKARLWTDSQSGEVAP